MTCIGITQSIVSALERSGRMDVGELADLTGFHKSQVMKSLQNLQRCGKVAQERKLHKRGYFQYEHCLIDAATDDADPLPRRHLSAHQLRAIVAHALLVQPAIVKAWR